MASVKTKPLSDVAASHDLKAAYEAIMAFNSSNLAPINISKDVLDRQAEREATMDPVQGGDRGFTAGMKSILCHAAAEPLAKWFRLRSTFDAAVQPFKEKIEAVQNFEDNKRAVAKIAQDKEEEVIRQAEASRSYLDKKREKETADQHYDQLMQGQGGRPVNRFADSWWYILILIGITSIEWLINYDSFFEWTRIPAMAAGFTLGMALAVAAAAHVHGEYLKQRNTRFGPASDPWSRHTFFLLLATAALVIAVIVAGYARYSAAMHSISSQVGIPNLLQEGISEGIDPKTEVYFSLGINLIVWLIALIVSFQSHDEDHKIMKAGRAKWRRTRQFNWADRAWAKQRDTIHAQLTRDTAHLRAATDLARVSTEDQRNKLAQVEKREQAIYKLLANNAQITIDLYRMALGKALEDNGNRVNIGGKQHTSREYMQMPTTIDAETLRTLIS